MAAETDRALRTVRRALKAYGVPRDRREEIVADLEAELAAVAADGGDPALVLGGDVEALAEGLAQAHGVPPVRGRVAALVACATVPAAIVAFATYLFVGGGPVLGLPYLSLAVSQQVVDLTTGSTMGSVQFLDSPGAALGVYCAAGVLALLLATGGAALFLHVRGDACVGPTVRQLMVLLPLGALSGCGLAVGEGTLTGFSTAAPVVGVEAATVAVAVAVAARAARLRARRRFGGGSAPASGGGAASPLLGPAQSGRV